MSAQGGEFDTIRRLFAPLAHPEWGLGLLDDAAVLPSRPGFDLVLTKDAMVEGVHFLPDDPPGTVARKLLRVNLSDLAAKAAEPFGYLLACGWGGRWDWPMREEFAAGLAADQVEFSVHLLGGDTVATPGSAMFSLTAFGWVPKGRMVLRSGARPGDLLFVTGTIGDGVLGLDAARGLLSLDPERIAALTAHYRTPMPRLAFRDPLLAFATAAADVSDGLVADVGHLATASAVRVELDLERLPLSAAAQAWFDGRADFEAALVRLATGGDDYEIVLSVRPSDAAAVRRAAEALHLRLTEIGRVTEGQGVEARIHGAPLTMERAGWSHGLPGESKT